MCKPVLIHLPHSSVHIPYDDRKEILLNNFELQNELLKMTDKNTDELFDFDGAVIHRNKYSRLVFDPERFRDDKDEMMAGFGMGAIYTHTEDGKLMRKLTEAKREEMLQNYYDPYHRDLEEKTQNLLDMYGKCLVIDGHSFPEKPLSFEADQNPDRPDICIGSHDFHTPEILLEAMENFLKSKKGMSVKRNVPFAGTMVPMRYYLKDKKVCSVMIEVNRKLYMDETTGEKLSCFQEAKAVIQRLIGEMIESFEKLQF